MNYPKLHPTTMKSSSLALCFLFSILSLLLLTPKALSKHFTRHDFPSTFVFGAGTSALQYEGALTEDGRSTSTFDETIYGCSWPDKGKASVMADGYHKYKEDVKLMRDTGLEAYRLSISWPRILPLGRGAVNIEGINYYNNVLNELAKQGILAHVTLSHLDTPKVLEDEYGGWSSPKIIDDFREFVDVCFREFGNKVSYWTTINEPNINGFLGNYKQSFGQSHKLEISKFMADNSVDMTYIIVHNFLIAHSEAVRLYRTKYQHYQEGQIGLNLYTFWCQPLSNSFADIEATRRVETFMFDWILNPIVHGDYPELMKKIASPGLPSFTKSQSEALKGSFDFIGINYYTSAYIGDNSNNSNAGIQSFQADMAATIRVTKNSPPTIGPLSITYVPNDFSDLPKMLQYLKKFCGNPPIYIHESGFPIRLHNVLNDISRIEFLKGYIGSTLDAIRDGVDIKGYFVWSFMDLFELVDCYTKNFGLYHVDFEDEKRPRTPKLSAHWYSNFLKNNNTALLNIEKSSLEGLPLESW